MLAAPVKRVLVPLALLVLVSILLSVYFIFGSGFKGPNQPRHLQPAWTWQGGSMLWHLCAASSGGYYAVADDKLYRIGPDGSTQWHIHVGSGSDALVVGSDRLYTTSWQGNLIAYDAATGKALWWWHVTHRNPDSEVAVPARVAVAPNGNVYVSAAGEIRAFDRNGKEQLTAPGTSFVPPQFDAKSNVYLAAPLGVGNAPGAKLRVYDVKGKVVYDAVALGEGEAYKVSVSNSQVWAYGEAVLRVLDAGGKQAWSKDITVKSLAVDGAGHAYCGTDDGRLLAFDAQGRQLWMVNEWVDSLNADGPGPLYAIVDQCTILALDKSTGRRQWDCTAPPSTADYTSPITELVPGSDGQLAFSGESGEVFCLKP